MAGAIARATIGAVAAPALLLAAVVVFLSVRRKQKRKHNSDARPDLTEPSNPNGRLAWESTGLRWKKRQQHRLAAVMAAVTAAAAAAMAAVPVSCQA